MKTNLVYSSLLFTMIAGMALGQAPPKVHSKWMQVPAPPLAGQTPTYWATAAKEEVTRQAATLTDRLSVQQGLPGTWLMHLTPEGSDAPPPFVGFATFHSDGTFNESNSNDLAPPVSTPGQGEWEIVAGKSFNLTFFAFAFDGPDYIGMFKVRATGQLGPSGTELAGVFKVEFLDPNGMVLGGGAGKIRGDRIKVEAAQ